MVRFGELVRSMATDQEGATLVEYGILVALIAAVCIGIITTIGGQIQTGFANASAGM